MLKTDGLLLIAELQLRDSAGLLKESPASPLNLPIRG
jgi:hypothetical protein